MLYQDEIKSLENGARYIGPVDRLKRPNGLGKEFYPPPNLPKIRYYGYYLNGKKHGNGTLYNIDGKAYYQGEFLNGNPISGKKRLKDKPFITKRIPKIEKISQKLKGRF